MAGVERAGGIKGKFLTDVPVEALAPSRFREVLSAEAYRELVAAIVDMRARMADRVIWNINSTARGGGVAEMLQSLIAYARGAGVDTRWRAIRADPDFFRITKRLHNQIHGFPGDGGELGPKEHVAYERAIEPCARELAPEIRRGDIVLLHDPQTAGFARELKAAGARVIWRCHVGLDSPTDLAVNAWEFLRPYLADADAYIFSREAFAWKGLERDKIVVIAPSIDPFTPKNSDLPQPRAAAILIAAGVQAGYSAAPQYYIRANGSLAQVRLRAEMVEDEPLVPDARYVVQVSRWDRLKDPVGVVQGFSTAASEMGDVHVVIAGPQPQAVADDPEGLAVFEETLAAWRALPAQSRSRVHVACLPMEDPEQNAAIVNALQTRAEVIIQKSLAEGFGLTVAEGMWKARPVVASRIGGIQDQIEHEKTGILLDDPRDLRAMGSAVARLLADPQRASEIGAAAHESVRRNFLNNRHLLQYAKLFTRLGA